MYLFIYFSPHKKQGMNNIPLPYIFLNGVLAVASLCHISHLTEEIVFVVEGILIRCRSVWLGRQPPCASLSTSWFGRQWCTTMKDCTAVFQHTKIKSKNNNVQRKGSPLSNQSIIWCNSGSDIYVSLTFIIHKEGKWRGNEHKSFPEFISLLRRKNPLSLSHTQTHITQTLSLHEASGFISILTCR